MKKMSLRIFTALLAAMLLASALTGCGKTSGDDSNNGNNANSDTPEYVYVADYVEMPEDVPDMGTVVVSGEKLYFSAWVQTNEDTGSGTYQLYSINLDGTGLTKLENYAPPAVSAEQADVANMEASISINALCVDSEGKLWIAENGGYYYFDLPDGFDAETDDRWQYYTSAGDITTLRRLDETGAELLSVDLSSLMTDADSESGSSFYIGSMAADGEGNVFITNEKTVYMIGSDGTIQGQVEAPNWINSVLCLSDGKVAISTNLDSGSYGLQYLDIAAKSLGETITLPTNVYNIYSGGGDYLCTMGDGSSLYGLRADTKESEKILSWLDSDINSDNIANIAVLPDGRVFCTNYSWDGDSLGQYELILLTRTEASAVQEKTILTLATVSLDYNLRNMILEFNKSNDSYRIQVKDYSEYNTDDDYNAGLTKLSTEIISGDVPDLLDVNSLPIKQYAAKGLLEDLYPYIENDTELNRDDFFDSVFSALELDGKLYEACDSFYIVTMAGNPDVVGSEPGWTMDEFKTVLQENSQVAYPLGRYYTQSDFLYYAMVIGMDQYVDWSTGKCSFDQGDFAQLLEFAKTFPAEVNYDDDDDYVSEYSLILSGEQLLSILSLGDFESMSMYRQLYGGKIVFKGLPNAQRTNAVISVNGGVAITSKCKDKDGAWSFVRRLLTQDWQESDSIWSFPTNKNAYNTKLQEAMKVEYTTDEDGNQVEVSKGSWYIDDNTEIEIHALTQEEADMMQQLIDSVGGTMNYDEKIMNIVTENTAAFFAGQKSAQETATIIQNRVSIYVAEQS